MFDCTLFIQNSGNSNSLYIRCGIRNNDEYHMMLCSEASLITVLFRYLGLAMRRRVFGHMRTAMTQISLRTRAV